MSRLVHQFSRYLLAGGSAFVVDFATLYFLTERLGFHYLVSATVAFLCGLLVNYLTCILWIFDYRRLNRRWQEAGLFVAIGIAGLGLNNLLLFGLTEGLGVHYLLSKTLTAGLVLLFNFFLRRGILFTRRPPPESRRA